MTKTFINPFENNAQYVLIEGVEIKSFYMARVPVTMGLWWKFIDYLKNNEETFLKALLLLAEEETKIVEALEARLTKRMYSGSQKFHFQKFLSTDCYFGRKGLVENLDSTYFLFGRKRPGQELAEHPIFDILHYGASAYCLWLSLLESDGAINNLYRLPTAKEWAYAAGLNRRKYPWGNEPPSLKHANYNNNRIDGGKWPGGPGTSPVGSYPKGATPEGLLDMLGNVTNLVSDRFVYGYYNSAYYWRPSTQSVGSDCHAEEIPEIEEASQLHILCPSMQGLRVVREA